jgi:SulP family sulfate permease
MIKRLRRRYTAAIEALPGLPEIKLRPAAALREVLAAGYTGRDLRADVMAGLVVGVVALPLSMALAIASGVAPQHGLYTAIIGGAACALLGGSRVQVSGPTAAFVVILAPIAHKFGLGGLCVATVLAGAVLFLLGALRMGQLIQYIPYPVTTGFTAGIAVVIATLQLKDFLGLTIADMPEHYTDRVHAIAVALPTTHWPDLAIGALTLAILLWWPRLTRRVPAPLVALAAASLAALALEWLSPASTVATIGSRFSYVADGVTHAGIPRLPPLPVLPWNLPGPDGQPLGLSLGLVRALLPSAIAIAMLGAIESLLSAVVADGMAGTRHDPDAELVAQGAGNLLAPFFGGFACTGAIARTATNIRAGARSPVASVVHAVFILVAVLGLAGLVSYLPMASLAALLLLVAWNMSELKHFLHMLRVAPKSDAAVLLTCFSLTVLFDMVISVTIGVMLAALLFMRRMAELTQGKLRLDHHPALREPLPEGVVLYEIGGPLFFGAAQKAMSSLDSIAGMAKVVILELSAVPVIDATGLVGLESALTRLHRDRVHVILVGLQPQPTRALEKAGILEDSAQELSVVADLHAAVELARGHLGRASIGPAAAA